MFGDLEIAFSKINIEHWLSKVLTEIDLVTLTTVKYVAIGNSE